MLRMAIPALTTVVPGPTPGDIMWASQKTKSSRLARDPLPTERAWLEGQSHVTGVSRTVRWQQPSNRLTSRGDCKELLTRGAWISQTSTGRSAEAPRTRRSSVGYVEGGGPAEETGPRLFDAGREIHPKSADQRRWRYDLPPAPRYPSSLKLKIIGLLDCPTEPPPWRHRAQLLRLPP
ncbi:hypothetical protein NDU88_003217 [Pleurodeles waltl]|uniref:Uncharacterized protein n=1 Tax=Pleurodeles waltl TaxID=8319 RepID=A0AAV7QE90_PLEWA|nr:hypothetical protein NDU88_003217 [Pleurodeles waltl]